MDPVTGAIIASAVTQAGMGLYGNKKANKASKAAMGEARGQRERARKILEGLEELDLTDFNYSPEELQYLSEALPEQYGMPEQYNAQDVQIDPKTRAIQMQALEEMKQRGEEGLTAADRYNFMKNRRNVETAARGQEEAIINNMRQRGMSGTGLEAALRMQASQGGSDRLAEFEALQALANSQQRMAATQAQSNMAGNIRGQDFQQANTNANILNEMAWRNSERNMELQNRNTDMRNRHNQGNVDERRRIGEANINERNKASVLNQQMLRDQEIAENQSANSKKTSLANAQLGGISDIYAQGSANADAERGKYGLLSSAIGTGMGLYGAKLDRDYDREQRQKDREAFGK